MEDEEMIVVCMAVGQSSFIDHHARTQGQVVVPCAECGVDLWVSNAMKDEGGKRICFGCAPSPDEAEYKMHPKVAKELEEFVKESKAFGSN